MTGDCEYNIVSATKGKPLFSKVALDGKLWYCGDEGEEFFLVVKNVSPSGQERSAVRLNVDNRDMKCGLSLKITGQSHKMGVLQPEGSFASLKFASPQVADSDDDTPLANAQAGNISFQWKESWDGTGMVPWTSPFEGLAGTASVGGGKKAGVGALASTKGSAKSAITGFNPN